MQEKIKRKISKGKSGYFNIRTNLPYYTNVEHQQDLQSVA